MRIEPASWRDLTALRHIERVCFPKDAWPLIDLVGVLTFPNVVRLKAVVDGGQVIEPTIIGFIAGDVRKSAGEVWIATIGVLPEYRRRGVARQLLAACEERIQAPVIRLCVRISNDAAIALYHNAGYQRNGIWQNYYEDGEDALVMEKSL